MKKKKLKPLPFRTSLDWHDEHRYQWVRLIVVTGCVHSGGVNPEKGKQK
jgi:hypothetical protein